MPPQTPLLLADNVFDTVVQYPAAVQTASAEVVGSEAARVADYRRERTFWTTPSASANHHTEVDLGAGASRAVDFLFLDRGHNLWGCTILVGYSTTGSAPFTTYVTLTVPALGTLGGDPTTTTMCVTEEGALWSLFTKSAARRAWQVKVQDNIAPIVPGILLGLRAQLLGFSAVFDEDAADRTQVTSVSTAGYQASDTTYSWRTLTLSLGLIGATEYDATIRSLKALLFDRNQPAVVALEYGTHPERMWMYQLDGKSWGMSKKRVYREGQMHFREVGQSLS